MPERKDYDEAIQFPQTRLKMPDTDLQNGLVEKMTILTSQKPITRPYGIQGGFAVVYKFRSQSGNIHALRCFCAAVDPDIQYRYEHIGPYFEQHIPTITAQFHYYHQGILLKEEVQGHTRQSIYPVIDMTWIEGLTLLDYLDEACSRQDKAAVSNLVKQWMGLVSQLRAAHISHRDLAGANILVRPDGQLILVDYDGVFIPDFATVPPSAIAGQLGYQHPESFTKGRPFDEYADDFSILVIYVALLALSLDIKLWERYTQRDTNDNLANINLLFTQEDFVDPDHSVLMYELSQYQEPALQKALEVLKQACSLPVEQVRVPAELTDAYSEQKKVLLQLQETIQRDDNRQILQLWSKLANYEPAQVYRQRVEQAKNILQALQRFRTALVSKNLQNIVSSYEPILDTCAELSGEERALFRVACVCIDAFRRDDDQKMVEVMDNLASVGLEQWFYFTPTEQQRLALAKQRRQALVRFQLALHSKNVQRITSAYDTSLLDTCKDITATQRDIFRHAQQFSLAMQEDNDSRVIVAADAVLNFFYRDYIQFTKQEQERIQLARDRLQVAMKWRSALLSKNMQHILEAYQGMQDLHLPLAVDEENLVQAIRQFRIALYNNRDNDIVEKAQHLQKQVLFSTQDQQRIDLAQKRTEVADTVRQVIASGQVNQIARFYDASLDQSSLLTKQEREILYLASQFVLAYGLQSDQADQTLVESFEDIQTSPYQTQLFFTEQERQRIALAQKRIAALKRFRLALWHKHLDAIVHDYDPVLDQSPAVHASERKLLLLARTLVQALQANDDEKIATALKKLEQALQNKQIIFTASEQERIQRAKRMQSKERE